MTEPRPQPDAASIEELGEALARTTRRKLGRSLSIREVDAGSCNGCELEIHALGNAFYDLERFGLRLQRGSAEWVRTTPKDFNRMFPATGGALYGQASHGWRAPFARPGARSQLAGLYLAGGSTHPGPGVPMAALSGHQAALCASSDLTAALQKSRA